jgi:hypothetical protein
MGRTSRICVGILIRETRVSQNLSANEGTRHNIIIGQGRHECVGRQNGGEQNGERDSHIGGKKKRRWLTGGSNNEENL